MLLLLQNLFLFGSNNRIFLFVGSYTDGKPDTGIYVFELEVLNGSLKQISVVDEVVNPSFLDISPDGKNLYVCTETKLPQNGNISAYFFNSENGTLIFLNKETTGGENPIYVAVDNSNRFVATGNYGSGNFCVFNTNKNNGLNPYYKFFQLSGSSINKQRQEKSHVHATVFSPDNKFLYVTDLGTDKISVYEFNAGADKSLIELGSLSVNCVPGSGPRHLTFHPKKNFAYCIEELSGTISAFTYNDGGLDSIQRIFACSEQKDVYSSADIHISPDGLFLYASNRIENTIAIFSVDKNSGRLKLIGHQSTFGDTPRNFTIDPTGNYLLVANQFSKSIVVFKRNIKTGMLTKTDTEIKIKGNPSCMKMMVY
jgi:6-phosphogluconolactonase